jgi:hypothetical protein
MTRCLAPMNLHLPSDNVTIWYVVTPHEGQEIISIQLVRLDT